MGKKARLKKIRKESPVTEGPLISVSTPFAIGEKAKKALAAIIIITLLVLGISLRLGDLEVKDRTPDEGFYMYQAVTITQKGLDAVRSLVDEHNADASLWIFPPPIRIGYMFPLAAVVNATHITDDRAGSYLSTACSISALFVLVLLGLRFFNPWITAAALLLISVSPMDLAIARRSWQDGFFALFAILLVYFCCELSANPKRTAWYVPFWFVGSYCILIKESGIIIYGLCVMWLLAVAIFRERSIIKAAFLIILTSIGICLSIFVVSHVVGGLERYLVVLKNWTKAMPTNTYAVEYQNGPWYSILEGLWILTPAGFFLAVAGIAGSLIDKAPRSAAAKGIVFILLAFLGITILTPYCQNIRYISAVYVTFYLMCGAGVWYIFSFAKSSLKAPMRSVLAVAIACALIAVSIRDYNMFRWIFIKNQVLDISIPLLREASYALQKVR